MLDKTKKYDAILPVFAQRKDLDAFSAPRKHVKHRIRVTKVQLMQKLSDNLPRMDNLNAQQVSNHIPAIDEAPT